MLVENHTHTEGEPYHGEDRKHYRNYQTDTVVHFAV